MGDENPIRNLGDYSKPSHEGYRNTIELLVGNNVVPLRSDTIRLVQNGCSFHGLRPEDPNQHLKDFLKLVDSLDLDGENRERTRLRLFQFSLCDQASNWLERLPAGSITTWEDLTTQSLSEAWTRFKNLLQKVPHHGINRWLQIQFFSNHVSFHLKCEIDRAAGSKLRNKNADESWEIIKDLALYDHKGWNDTKYSPSQSMLFPHLKSPQNPNPQPQALGTTFEARVRDYMASHTERIERFESAIFKQREEINGRMTEMFRLLKELTTSKAPEKVLIREEAKSPITKSVNCISLIREDEEKSDMHDVAPGDDSKETVGLDMEVSVKEAETNNGAESKAKNKQIKDPEKEEAVETPSSRPVEYYLKHRINEKLIEGLVDNKRGPVYEAILKKKITKKEDIGGNFEIPCSIEGLKHVNVLVDQGSDVNVMPYSTYMKLTDERPTETGIRLSLASHSYIYPLGIDEDVLVEIDEHIYPMDFVILDIKEDEKRPFILGTPFLTTAKAMIKFDKGTITLSVRSEIQDQ
ncbi:MAK10-like protein [Tanacetum coccineum]